MDNDVDDDFSGHKLSGYLFAVLSPPSSPEKTLTLGTRCLVSQNEAALVTECGVVLTPPPTENDVASHTRGNSVSRKKKRMGMVNGSMSIVHQIHALVTNNCLKIDAMVVGGGGGGDEEGCVVVLIDVYLPLEAFFGEWQFPRNGVVAGAVFRHLSCDWASRSLSLSREDDHKDIKRCLKSSCGLSVCHVLGCKLHHDVPATSKSTIFDLSEIFKSLPSVAKKVETYYSRVKPVHDICESGIWDLSDDILLKMLTVLSPIDLARAATTCRHLRSVASSIMPSMKLKLFPHQQAAIDWMLQRERSAEEFLHPLYKQFSTEDGITYYVNTVSGEIVNGVAPTIKDFCGGMFCDEPGLGKTITALSLILKTQGTLPNPPPGTKVIWCTHNGNKRCGYYELHGNIVDTATTPGKNRAAGENARSRHMTLESIIHDEMEYTSPKRAKLAACNMKNLGFGDSCSSDDMGTPTYDYPVSAASSLRKTRSVFNVKKNLLHDLSGECSFSIGRKSGKNPRGKKQISNIQTGVSNDTWVQCDACNKWRKLACKSSADVNAAWFCSMNTDPLYQCCSAPEESCDNHSPITYFPGYCTKGTSSCLENNVAYFVDVLRENSNLINSETKKALKWLANLSPEDLSEIETRGLRGPFVSTSVVSERVAQGFHKVFKAFGLVKSMQKGVVSWHYPPYLENLAFDVGALRTALCEPLDSVRLYMSKATLIVVPTNLVDHWKTQIEKHVRARQLRLFVWTDYRKPAAHVLAWDYDVVITTFNRLSAEWGPHKKSVMMQVHWRRIMLDEGHTLGASLALTNKLQMAISLVASSRWILTGTPTPNTPSSQLSHLLPIIKFLHEEAYGKNQKSWEDGILRPFEAEMEDGRLRLLELLNRCMISARKADLKSIPPCIKQVTYLEFTENHARSYNELVVTVRRNILMADWNDPSHVESLLNRKQWKFRSTTLRNVRLSCCVAGQIKVTCAGEDIQETMDILVANGLDPASQEYAFIKYNLSYGGNCFRCKEWCRLPIVTPCRHLLCLDCVALSSEQCSVPGCGYHYEMQTPDTRPENPNPKWPVPKDLIELQPSYKQDDWHPDWQSTSSSKVNYLVDRLVELHKGNETIDAMDESSDYRHLESDNKNSVKVIIFSQFLEHIHVIEQQLTFADIGFAGMYSPMHSAKKLNSLAKFQHDVNCMALVMDGSAALGLDLSFVTHVFLMEPIWDRSMEEQVISRAHRMGATRPINVETLAMRGTIEEQMLQCLQDVNGCRRVLKVGNGLSDNEGPRAHRSLHEFAESNYLSKLTSVLTNHQN